MTSYFLRLISGLFSPGPNNPYAPGGPTSRETTPSPTHTTRSSNHTTLSSEPFQSSQAEIPASKHPILILTGLLSSYGGRVLDFLMHDIVDTVVDGVCNVSKSGLEATIYIGGLAIRKCCPFDDNPKSQTRVDSFNDQL